VLGNQFAEASRRRQREREMARAWALDVSFKANTFFRDNGGAWAPVWWSFELCYAKPRLRWHWRQP
jgi:hypothetical protein